MGKLAIEGINPVNKDIRGSRYSKKHMSHGSCRAKRKPNSKRVRNGQVRPHVED